MPSETTGSAAAFAETARIIARGGDLDARIRALTIQARRLTGAAISVIYLLDARSRQLTAVAWDGVADEDATALSSGDAHTVEATGASQARLATGPANGPAEPDDSDPAIRVLMERRPEIVEAARARALGPLAANLAAVAYAPLVAEDSTGGLEVEGVLVAGVRDSAFDARTLLGTLETVADLCAAAIRLSRLERALGERSDWVERVAQTDALTGLANRRTFDRVLELELARAARQGTPISVALFDVDGLDRITSRHGAVAADDVLRRVAATVSETVRLVDTVGRYGGDEFALVAPGAAGRAVAARVLEQIANVELLGAPGAVTLSAGVARFPEDGATAQELLSAAEKALHEAKQQGGGSLAGGDGPLQPASAR